MQSVTLNENRDFRRAYAKGKSRVHRLLVTYVLKNRLGVNRVGFTATKKNRQSLQTQPRQTSYPRSLSYSGAAASSGV